MATAVFEGKSSYEETSIAASPGQRVRRWNEDEAIVESSNLSRMVPERATSLRRALDAPSGLSLALVLFA